MPARAAARRSAPVSSDTPNGARRGAQVSARAARGGGGGRVSHDRFAEIQRARLLAAAVRAVDELGYPDTSVADITVRARVSRRTFYELFADREACLATVLEDVLGLLSVELAAAGLEGLGWRERVRGGLWAILAFFDREPMLARVCVVQALRGGPRVLERREAVLARLSCVVGEGRGESARAARCSALTAEGLVGAAFSIVYARLLRGERRPLTSLLGELMGMIVLPYLGPVAARREQARPVPAAPAGAARRSAGSVEGVVDPLGGVAMRLTYRTARVLEGIAELGGGGSSPSNRQVGERAGISDPGQVSRLLARLERLGLLANTGPGRVKGEPNAWALTAKGELVARSIRMHAPVDEACAGAPLGASLFTDRGGLPSVLEEEMVR
jgi:AcrR family transcriptional regulator